MILELHHTGCAVTSIDESVEFYKKVFGEDKISPKILVQSQGVFVCFVEIAPYRFLELIEPADEHSFINKLLKKNIQYYHIGYWAGNDFDKTIEELNTLNCKLINIFHSEAFNNRRCAFLYAPDSCLIELIEKGK